MSKQVYFANAGLIDLDVIRVMGVSVKEHENPIGYFGTGLKYAIAVLLRTGHQVELFRGDERFEFSARQTSIRGEAFDVIFMNDERLPFTTGLGKKWDVWQAYRELHSNTLDEVGTIADKPIRGDTVIRVTGDAFHGEYINRDKIFVPGSPIAAHSHLEVYSGKTNAVFYRGVRVGFMPTEMAFTYNILTDMDLSEDRMIKSQWDLEWKLSQLIPRIDHKGVASGLLEGTETWDQNLDFTRCASPSQAFLEVAAARYSDVTAPKASKKLVERDMQKRGEFPHALGVSEAEWATFYGAFESLPKLGCSLSPEDVELVETLGPGVMGIYHTEKDQIFLARSTLDHGPLVVVSTLYEEWLHKEYHYRDQTRELQNFLFQRLAAIALGQKGPDPEKQNEWGI